MTERRCQSCGHFYDKRLPECPECEAPRYAFNAGLVSARFATALNAKAARAEREG